MFVPTKDRPVDPGEVLNSSPVGSMILFMGRQTEDNLTQNNDWVSVIGFGGNHYATKFTRYMLDSEYAFGHIYAKYAIQSLNKELIHQMILKTLPAPSLVLFDKKSMKRKQQIRTWLSEFEIEVKQI